AAAPATTVHSALPDSETAAAARSPDRTHVLAPHGNPQAAPPAPAAGPPAVRGADAPKEASQTSCPASPSESTMSADTSPASARENTQTPPIVFAPARTPSPPTPQRESARALPSALARTAGSTRFRSHAPRS